MRTRREERGLEETKPGSAFISAHSIQHREGRKHQLTLHSTGRVPASPSTCLPGPGAGENDAPTTLGLPLFSTYRAWSHAWQAAEGLKPVPAQRLGMWSKKLTPVPSSRELSPEGPLVLFSCPGLPALQDQAPSGLAEPLLCQAHTQCFLQIYLDCRSLAPYAPVEGTLPSSLPLRIKGSSKTRFSDMMMQGTWELRMLLYPDMLIQLANTPCPTPAREPSQFLSLPAPQPQWEEIP